MEWDSNSGEPGIGGRGIRELCLLLNFSVTLKLSKKKKTRSCITDRPKTHEPSQIHPLDWVVF